MKKQIYKKWWFWVIVVILVIAILPSEDEASADGPQTDPSSKYYKCSVSELIADLDANALHAKEEYQGKYVEITGRVDVIDASGKYISLYPTDNEWELTGVQCFIENKEQKEYVRNISKGDIVTLRGKITSVGEIMGYSLDIHEFVE